MILPEQHVARASAICVVTSVLWIAALGFAALGWIGLTGDGTSVAAAWTIALVLVLASGPVAYAIGRDRRLLALPLVGIAVALLATLLSAVRLLAV